MKTFVITVSREFPSKHIRRGNETNFVKKILNNYTCKVDELGTKLHTCRSNYEYWKRIVDEVNAGKAILSVRYWSGKPRKSKQVEIVSFDYNSGIGIQKLIFEDDFLPKPTVDGKLLRLRELSKNDGLEFDDFLSWFEGYDLTEPLAIIHFTKFRY
jgi:hypothetical protein